MRKKKEETKEEKEEDLLKELCGDDAELYGFLGRTLYLDPMAAISKKDLEILIEEAEKSIKDGNYEEAMWKYREVLDKAIFEATQNPGERGRYIKVIQDLASKAVHVTEKAKEKIEKKGLTDYATSFERRIENYKLMSKRIDDVVNVASHFYDEKLAIFGDVERREARREKIRAMETEVTREASEAEKRRGVRREARKEMGREARREAEKEEKIIREREEERREVRREEIRGMEQEERQEAWGDKERRETRRKKRREARRK